MKSSSCHATFLDMNCLGHVWELIITCNGAETVPDQSADSWLR